MRDGGHQEEKHQERANEVVKRKDWEENGNDSIRCHNSFMVSCGTARVNERTLQLPSDSYVLARIPTRAACIRDQDEPL